MTQLKDGGSQPSNREERSLSASTVIARWQGNGWDRPCKSTLRTVLWAAEGEIPLGGVGVAFVGQLDRGAFEAFASEFGPDTSRLRDDAGGCTLTFQIGSVHTVRRKDEESRYEN